MIDAIDNRDVRTKALKTGIILLIVDTKKTFMCFEKMSLIKQQQFKFVERFSELVNKSQMFHFYVFISQTLQLE